MIGLVRAELLKIRSTRMWWGLLAGTAAFVALTVVATVLAAGQQGAPSLDDPATVRSAWAAASSGTTFTLILGILAMTTEFRHQTISATFLATPRRARVVVAKMLANGLFGTLFGLVGTALTAALAFPLLALRDAPAIPGSTIAQVLVAGVLGTGVYAVVGVGVGALVRNQIAAILGSLVWVMLIEALLVALLPEVGRWLPGGAASAMLQVPSIRGELLPTWAGTTLFVGYGLAFAAAAVTTTLRRDIT